MDSLNYAAWVLKPTADGTASPSQTPVSDAKAISNKAMVVASSPMEAGSADGMTKHSAEEKEETAAPSDVLKLATVEGKQDADASTDGVLLFIDEEHNDEHEHMDTGKATVTPQKEPTVFVEEIKIPLIDYLCALNECSLRELQLLMYNVQARKRMIMHLQQHCRLRTAHLRPAERNQWLHAHDLSTQSVNRTYACGGYLELSVRQYYYAKHAFKIKHPFLPCLIEFGGGEHASFYPLEVIIVVIELQPLEQWKRTCPTVLKRATRAVPWLPYLADEEEEEGGKKEEQQQHSNHNADQKKQDTPTTSASATAVAVVPQPYSGRLCICRGVQR